MTTKEIDKLLERLHDEGLEKGLEKGREEGFAQAVIAAYRARFGEPPSAFVAAVGRASNQAALQRLLKLVTTRTAEDVAAALRRSAQTKRGARATNRRVASPRREATSR